MNNHRDNEFLNDQRSKVPFGVSFIRNCILILAIIFSAALFVKLLSGFSVIDIERLFRVALQCGILWVIFFGLKKEKSWTVILVLLCAYFAFFITILGFFQTNVVNGYDLLKKFFQLCLILFYAFQIVVFSRSETKHYFKEKGTIVVS